VEAGNPGRRQLSNLVNGFPKGLCTAVSWG